MKSPFLLASLAVGWGSGGGYWPAMPLNQGGTCPSIFGQSAICRRMVRASRYRAIRAGKKEGA